MHSIHDSARIGAGASLGEGVVIEAGAVLGDGCVIGHHVVIRRGTRIGARVRIDDFTTIGKQPLRSVQSATTANSEEPPAEIGDDVLIGGHVVINAGARIAARVLVADHATVREGVSVGERTIVGRGVAIENRCTIGARCKLETNVYVCALSTIEDDCFLAPCVAFTNDNCLGRDPERFAHHRGPHLRRGARVGAHSTILPGKTLGEECMVGAHSAVTKDVPARMLVMGVPARVVRPVDPRQWLENQ